MQNPFPPKPFPEFVPYKDGLLRGLAVWRGHERLVIRQDELTPGDGLRAGDFGISDDDWVFALRDAEHVATAQVSSQSLNGRLYRTPAEIREEVRSIWTNGKPGPQCLKARIDFCASYPTSEESVRGGSVGSDCGFQSRGKCFRGASTILGGDPIVVGLDSVFMQGPPDWWTSTDADVVKDHLFAFSDIWEKLEGWFVEQRLASKSAALELPRQCEHCKGRGTVP